jgi:hypothetical protein
MFSMAFFSPWIAEMMADDGLQFYLISLSKPKTADAWVLRVQTEASVAHMYIHIVVYEWHKRCILVSLCRT